MTLAIQNQIESSISNMLDPYKTEYTEQKFEFEILCSWLSEDECEVKIIGFMKNKYKPNEIEPFTLLKLYIYPEWNQIHITNIFLPDFMKYKGIGKRIINDIFIIAKQEQYSLFIVDMVDSFYNKMIKRGAAPCKDCYDAVQIVDETKLL
ncbi:MAG: hypothetical protein IJE43_25040 [Alphaproteobacteria bacterium]|nr:hypothetical protein [Alphaproteobacteria bacterium]MBQ6849533.1 hypothetical protein [Oscillospiraceae bacterium]